MNPVESFEAGKGGDGTSTEPKELTLTSEQLTSLGLDSAADGDQLTITGKLSRDAANPDKIKLSDVDVQSAPAEGVTEDGPQEKAEPSAAERMGIKPRKQSSMGPKAAGLAMEDEEEEPGDDE